MERNVLVRVGKKDYPIPHEDFMGHRLVMVTDNPGRRGVLTWRLLKGPNVAILSVQEAALGRRGIREGKAAAIANATYYETPGRMRVADVWHFLVSKKLRRKTVGTAMRELLLREFRDSGANRAVFPYHREREFYEKRGFTEYGNYSSKGVPARAYRAELKEAGVKPGGVRLRVLWKRSRPRYLNKARRSKK